MKFTILGFNQKVALNLNLDITDLLILRWFIDFYHSEKMVKMNVDGEEYVWVSYSKIIQDMPILNMQKVALARRYKKLCDVGIMKHKTLKENGTFSLYKLTNKYEQLISDTEEYEGSTQKYEGYDLKVQRGSTQKYEQKINLLNDESIKNNNTPYNPPKGENKKINEELFNKFWNEYPKKKSKGNVEKWFEKNKPSEDLINLMIDKLKILKTTEQWTKKNGQYIPYPTTWLNAKGWEDEITTEEHTESDEEELARLQAQVDEMKARGEW